MPPARTPSNGDRRALRAAALVLALAPLLVAAPRAHAGDARDPLQVCTSAKRTGPDTLDIGGSRPFGLDRGLAQSFDAADTLVRAISVWLPGYYRRLPFPLHLYVTRADRAGRPLLEAVIADGGTSREGAGRGMGPARFTFAFSPPLSLPEPGAYAFVLMPDECGVAALLTTAGDAMPRGALWEIGRRDCIERPATVRSEIGGRDLVHEIEFCDRGTGVHGRTWGEIKTRYR